MDARAFGMQFGPAELARLDDLVATGGLRYVDDLDSAASRRRLREVEVLITSWGAPPLTEQRLADAPHLRAVFHSAGSVRHLVSEELWRREILVTTAAAANAVAVAEFTLAAIIFAGKKAPFLAADARSHRDSWDYVVARGSLTNRGRVVGIVGFSRVGRQVVERLRALEVADILVYDPVVPAAEIQAAGGTPVALAALLPAADIVSLHAPALAASRRMIGAAELALLQTGATLINTARGQLVDTAALEQECASGRINAMLDVTDPEPLPAESVLYDLPNVMITPHIAGSLGSETQRMVTSVLGEVERYVDGLPPLDPVERGTLGVSA
ncbi:hydroxyacid dehydrogenase [Georgenia wutianyii]|uniref:Hydroxyacid dehydrogenase n=1 Tax=Georgenia wutianyii TaxID=2585135 RepID=A0ABX5VSS1_9MICO|nr:hydroxyacid dehydrogenase [Georgenia wutianyii]QDB80801.1 hydroxyacid dehydrogenase [Georgenia wutianyii]